MTFSLFAGIPVGDYETSLAWYNRLLGTSPKFQPTDTEAVWELATDRLVYIDQRPKHAGHAMHTIVVDDFDKTIAHIAGRGLEPEQQETYPNGARKATYRDPDGNEIAFGCFPPE